MKKILFLLFISLFVAINDVNASGLKDIIENVQGDPVALLIYAPWVEESPSYLMNFSNLENEYSQYAKFAKLDITTFDMKYFNSRFELHKNIPYVLIFRDGGKFTRYLDQKCARDYSCLSSKVKDFLRL